MSNCVNIHSTIIFKGPTINVEKLFEDIDRVNQLTALPCKPELSFEENTIWWFLGRDNVWMDGKDLCVNLGEHRSTHTSRDLKQTLYVLNSYMTVKNQKVTILLSDEFDGFNQVFEETFDLDTVLNG